MSDLPYLPPEVIEEILSRVPAISLKRFRSTCKRWNAFFKDQRFRKKHFDKATKQFLVLMLHERKVSSLNVNLQGIENNIAAPFIEFKIEHSLTQNLKNVVFHCDGLFLCTTNNNYDSLVVWNPCTDETKFIIPCNRSDEYSMFALGYENKNSCRNYKILRYRSNKYPSNPIVEFEIYEFSSGSWRFIDVTATFLIISRGVSLKGNTYWLTDGNYLLSFDFSTETLGRLRLPFKKTCCDTAALSTVGEDQLSVFCQNINTLKVEIWVWTSNKIDETIVLPWTKFLAIDIYKLSVFFQFSSILSFFIDEEKKVVVCCDCGRNYGDVKNMVQVIGEYGVYRKFQFGEYIHKSGRAVIFDYVPSLVNILDSPLAPRES